MKPQRNSFEMAAHEVEVKKYTHTPSTSLLSEKKHNRNDFIGDVFALIIGLLLGVFIIFALSIVSQIMV